MTRPVVEILYPKGHIENDLNPRIEWSYSDEDLQPQYSYRIYIEEYREIDAASSAILLDAYKNLYNYDTGEIVSTNNYHLLQTTLPSHISTFKIILGVKDTNYEPSRQVEQIFTIGDGSTASAKVMLDSDYLITDSFEPIIKWNYADPAVKPQYGYRIIFKEESGNILYDSNLVGSKDNYFKLPGGILSSASLSVDGYKLVNIFLTVYGNNDSASDSGVLTIRQLVPEVRDFLINGQKTVGGLPPQTFNRNVTLTFDVLYATEMAIAESDLALANPEWIEFQREIYYRIMSPLMDTPISIWVKFRTANKNESTPVYEQIILTDPATIRPAVIRRVPLPATTDFGFRSPVMVYFNKPMDRATIERGFKLMDTAVDEQVYGIFTWELVQDRDILTFQPSQPLRFGGPYTASIGPYNINVNDEIVQQYPRDLYAIVLDTISWDFFVEESTDLAAPTNGSVIIEDEKSLVIEQKVSLALSADGEPAEMYIYGDIVGDTTGWIPFKATYDVKVTPVSGLKIINVLFKDEYGNISEPASDSIIYNDVTPPAVPTLYKKATDSVDYPYVALYVNVTANTRVVLFKDEYVRSYIGDATSDVLGELVFNDVPLSSGTNSFYAKSIDENNNMSSSSNVVYISYSVPDRIKPGIYRTMAVDNTHVEVYFTEPMKEESVGNAVNYFIEDLNVNFVEILGAVSENDTSYWAVRLTTSSHGDRTYVLKTKNLVDLSDNGMDENQNYSVFLGKPIQDTASPILVNAMAITNTIVEVEFSELMDEEYAMLTSQYEITGLSLYGVMKTDNPKVYRIMTSGQSSVSYKLSAFDLKDIAGNLIDELNGTAIFKGIPTPGSGTFEPLRAYAVNPNRVYVEFTENVDLESATNINNYSIIGLEITGSYLVNENTVALDTTHQLGINYVVTCTNIKALSPVSA